MPAGNINYVLRNAEESDYDFIKGLYIDTMEPLLSALDAWNPDKNIASFNKTYRFSEAKIIVVDGEDAGWFQLHPTNEELSLHQIHIKPEFQNRNIGTRIIKTLIRKAEKQDKKLTLMVVKNNRALKLYQRLGFEIIDEDETKYHLST